MRQIEAAISVAAPPAAVWRVLTDFAVYPDWNPFVLAIAGDLVAGAALLVTLRPPGRRAMTMRPSLLVAQPDRELRWRGHLLFPGLFDGEHYFRLAAEADGGCRFTQGEIFSGLLPGLMGEGLYAAVRDGFVAMNTALKARAEAM